MELGEKISSLRKRNGMTQAELGEKLGVTYQAVSKWERNESLPDFDMMSKLAKLCGVSIAYFEDGAAEENYETAEPAAIQNEPVTESAPFGENVLGVCVDCGKIVKKGDEVEGASKLICKKCEAARKQEIMNRKAAIEEREQAQKRELKGRFKKRAVIAAVVAGIIALAFLIVSFVFQSGITASLDISAGVHTVMVIVGFIMLFSWIFQLFFDGVVREVTCWGFAAIKLPGIIFSADLEGLIFLVVMKIFLFILSGIISCALIFATSFLAMVIGLVTFVPVVIKIARPKDDDLLD